MPGGWLLFNHKNPVMIKNTLVKLSLNKLYHLQ